jgi:hypothetical protein
VPHEDPVVQPAGGLPLLLGVEPLFGFFERRRVGEDLDSDRKVPAIGRNLEVTDIEREVGDLLRLAAIDGDPPDLRRIGAAGEEVDRRTVRGPAGRAAAGRVGCQAAQTAPVGIDEPDVIATLVGVEIGLPQRERDLLPVGGRIDPADAVHGEQVVHGERVRRSLADRPQDDQQERNHEDGGGQTEHGRTPV